MTSIESDPATPSAIARQSNDRFLWGFPLFALCCEVFLVWLTYLERFGAGPLISAFFLSVLVALAMIVIALVGVAFLFLRKFRRAAALLLAPLIIASPMLFLSIVRCQYVAFDWMRFQITKGKYLEEIDKLSPAERASQIVIFDWGREGMAGTAISEYWLVYDESGEIALPDEDRSQAWKDRAKQEKLFLTDERCTFETYHVSGHFYSAANTCPYYMP